MTEEEKQAVEKMQYILDLINKNGQYTADKKDIKHIIVITNLIIKYQKEIEELKKPKYIIDCKTNEITTLTNDFVSKDKIREKIEFYKRYGKIKNSDEYVMSVEIEVLEELLGE